jgi:hypothetical protein
MNEDNLNQDFLDLVDAYCSERIDDASLHHLEEWLLASEDARKAFVAYFQMHSDLLFEVRAGRATSAVLDQVMDGVACSSAKRGASEPRLLGWMARAHLGMWPTVAASLLLAVCGFAVGLWGRLPIRPETKTVDSPVTRPSLANVAWLVNAQDCEWATDQSGMPGRDMRAGKTLRLRRGLVEIEFERGARLILQGPAGLELISGNEARLVYGALTARVPERARGFTVYSPRGKVVDLGTEFGLSVDENGGTAVRVFEGTVVASPIAGGKAVLASSLTLHEDQVARIDDRAVALEQNSEAEHDPLYVREIVPPPIITARSRTLNFTTAISGSLKDIEGRGVGLTHRLPGTGGGIPPWDANLRLDPKAGTLELTTTRSDINTQLGMGNGEYLGVPLSDLGFTGDEDFAISATLPNIPSLKTVGQFGLYAGSRSDQNIRGGLISQPVLDSYMLFLVNNDGGRDSDLYEVGLMSTGDDLRLTLRRLRGAYSLIVENLTKHSSSTLAIAHPRFLDGERDLYLGVFGANPRSDVPKTLTIKEIEVKVWTVSSAKGTVATEPRRTGSAAG